MSAGQENQSLSFTPFDWYGIAKATGNSFDPYKTQYINTCLSKGVPLLSRSFWLCSAVSYALHKIK